MAVVPKARNAKKSTKTVVDDDEYELGPNEEWVTGFQVAPGLIAGMIGPLAPGQPRPKAVRGILRTDPVTGMRTIGPPDPKQKKKTAKK